MTLTQILNNAFTGSELDERDQAARELARIYAETVDIARIKRDSKTIGDIGPKLTALLKELHMTPASRAIRNAMEAGEEDDAATRAAEVFAELRSN